MTPLQTLQAILRTTNDSPHGRVDVGVAPIPAGMKAFSIGHNMTAEVEAWVIERDLASCYVPINSMDVPDGFGNLDWFGSRAFVTLPELQALEFYMRFSDHFVTKDGHEDFEMPCGPCGYLVYRDIRELEALSRWETDAAGLEADMLVAHHQCLAEEAQGYDDGSEDPEWWS